MATLAEVALEARSLQGPVACVDLETTGGMAAQHRIIEVGIVLLERGQVVEEWSTLVHPGMRIPSSIVAFTGIDDTMVADACSIGTSHSCPVISRYSSSWSAKPLSTPRIR